MDRAFLVLTTFAFALAGCSGAQDEAAIDKSAALPADAGQPSDAAAPPASVQAEPEPEAMRGGFTPFVDPDGAITQGRCHMDACSWMKWESLEVVDASGGEVELRATILGGVSDHARNDGGLPEYPETADGVEIDWDPEPSVVNFRCSKRQPSIQWGDESTVALPFRPDDFIPGAMEGAARSYFAACHGDLAPGPGNEAVVKYEYHVPSGR